MPDISTHAVYALASVSKEKKPQASLSLETFQTPLEASLRYLEAYSIDGVMFPSLEGLACLLKLTLSELDTLRLTNKEFDHVCERIILMQKKIIMEKTASGDIAHAYGIALLERLHDMARREPLPQLVTGTQHIEFVVSFVEAEKKVIDV